ncbi:MAG: hypothetical protein H3C31_01895 [Brumimicrobium sp.]|nr:hypothetical protein [Brumimicrobium sp.]
MRKITISLIAIGFLYSCGTTKKESSNTINPSTQTTVQSDQKEEVRITERPLYQATSTVSTDIKHTKLEVNFNWAESQMNGLATITCSPHFYPSDSLILDAKSMEIKSVKLNDKSLNFRYNKKMLRIGLDKTYSKNDTYSVVIDYISKPEEKEEGGSAAISSDKGLYFINPRNERKGQMPQIWTQGETESNSVWFPTIDKPNQKTSFEIFITVENKYKTLSNGTLLSSQINNDGTRTDHWKQDLPHAPYLCMLAVGEFSIIEDSYTKNDGSKIPVNYYVEPEWAPYAKDIFGETPAMIKFFSDILGVEYQWDKYHQIVVREYVSGAMENTGAVVFGDFAYKTRRELIDENDQSTIAHELFHHWFGDLVTAESWSNLPLNESFANYSQYLWDEHRYGVDEADYNAEIEANGYYASAQQVGYHDMVWFGYDSREEMFDGHSYNKGGRILHMLRTYVGDEAFFASLKDYLETNKFGAAEMDNLRLSFEKITGEDLNWFFNQWFFASYHPELTVTPTVNGNEVTLKVEQKQDLSKAPIYRLPLKVGIYANNQKKTFNIIVDKVNSEFTFPFEGELQNVVFDEDRALLGKIKFEKPREWYIHQYYHAPKFIDRKEAVVNGSKLKSEDSYKMIADALNDKFWDIRSQALSRFLKMSDESVSGLYAKIVDMAQHDENPAVRASAILILTNKFYTTTSNKEQINSVYEHAIQQDSSYSVVAQALGGMTNSPEGIKKALELCKGLEKENSSSMKASIVNIYTSYGDTSDIRFVINTLKNGEITGYNSIGAISGFSHFFAEQDFAFQNKNFDVFETISKDGGAYSRAVLPYVLIGLQRNTDSQIEYMEGQLSDKSVSQVEKDAIRIHLEEAKKLSTRIQKLINK